jgi:glycosyltransferase involved in cell wall biosynthesis
MVIPVLNEARVLERSVVAVRQFLLGELPYRWRIVIADNGSTDGTDRIARRLAAELSQVQALRLDVPGRGHALRRAWTDSDAAVVSYMDVDLSTELAAVPTLIRAIAEEGYDVATGSRLLPASRVTRSWKREIVSRAYNAFVRAALGTRFSDAQCGFKAVSREIVERVVPQIQDQSWFFDTELLVLAEKQGYRIKDIPIVWIEDDDSRVRIVRTAWDDARGVFRLRRQLGRQRSPQLAGSIARDP